MSRLCRLKSVRAYGDDGKWAYAEIVRLRQLLKEAADDIEEWGAYADEYFREKHNLAACVEKYRKGVK